MEWLAALLLIAVTAAIAFTMGKNQSPSQQKIEELENLVVEKDAELQKYREQVSNHFQKTAQMFGKVTQEYQALYQHMAHSSQALAGEQPFKAALENQAHTARIETAFKGEETFSNESFYNAHEYRNQEDEEKAEVKEKEPDSADIIHLDKAKEDSSSPALDYAVKEDGVINHNSLNMENVKT